MRLCRQSMPANPLIHLLQDSLSWNYLLWNYSCVRWDYFENPGCVFLVLFHMPLITCATLLGALRPIVENSTAVGWQHDGRL